METFLSPVGLHGFGNIQSLGSVKQQGKMSGWRGYCVSGGGERVVCVCVCVWGLESACNVGDPSSIPGLGRSPREEIGYPLQYSWASLVAQLAKNLPAMWEIWVQSLGWEDPLEKGKATHSTILAWRIPWTI